MRSGWTANGFRCARRFQNECIRLLRLPLSAIRVNRRQQLEHRLALGPAYDTGSDLVFANPVGGPIYDSTVRRAFYGMVEKAGVGPLRIHDLRHNSATLMLRAGVGVQVVSQRLGHAKAGFTLSTYAHVLPDQQKAAAAALDSILVGKWSQIVGEMPILYLEFGGAYGIRTRDLRLERAASWAARRMRRLAAELGFEPRLTDPESAVLPLHHSAV